MKTLRAARFALGAESFAFGRTLNVRISLPLGASLDSGDLELALRVVAALKVAEGERSIIT